MGLLDRLHKLDDGAPDILAEPELDPGPRKEKVDAILSVLVQYLDRENTFASTLYAIARKELAACDEPRLDMVIVGVVQVADQLKGRWPGVVQAAQAEEATG